MSALSKIPILPLFFLLAGPIGGIAQADSSRLSNSFNFEDGIYYSHAAFLADRPDLAWEDVKAELVVNTSTFQARLGRVEKKDSGEPVATTSLWGFSKGGVPYLRVQPEHTIPGASHFSALQFTGRVSYFGYPEDSTRQVTITAYNPLTGRPFREGKVPRTESYLREFILDVKSGAIAPLTWSNLRPWVRDDAELLQQAEKVPEEELDLIRILQAYDRRNPLYIKTIE